MFFILVFLALICVGISVWALADVASKPESAFVNAGLSKVTWVVLIAVFIVVFAPVAFVLSMVYLLAIRTKLLNPA
jgi:hypothetical protein